MAKIYIQHCKVDKIINLMKRLTDQEKFYTLNQLSDLKIKYRNALWLETEKGDHVDGRRIYQQEIIDEVYFAVLDRVENGEGIIEACEAEGMVKKTLYRRLNSNRKHMLTRAKETYTRYGLAGKRRYTRHE